MSTCADMRGCSSLANELSVLAHTWNKLFMTISIDGQLANAYVYVQTMNQQIPFKSRPANTESVGAPPVNAQRSET